MTGVSRHADLTVTPRSTKIPVAPSSSPPANPPVERAVRCPLRVSEQVAKKRQSEYGHDRSDRYPGGDPRIHQPTCAAPTLPIPHPAVSPQATAQDHRAIGLHTPATMAR